MKMDLAWNNLQRLICHKTQQTKQTKPNQTRIITQVTDSISFNDKKYTKSVSLSTSKSNGLLLKNTPTASLQRGKITRNFCPRYNKEQSNDENPVISL